MRLSFRDAAESPDVVAAGAGGVDNGGHSAGAGADASAVSRRQAQTAPPAAEIRTSQSERRSAVVSHPILGTVVGSAHRGLTFERCQNRTE